MIIMVVTCRQRLSYFSRSSKCFLLLLFTSLWDNKKNAACAWLGPNKRLVLAKSTISSSSTTSSSSNNRFRKSDTGSFTSLGSSASPDRSGDTNMLKPTLVVGATGLVGRRVVQQLLGQNHPVRALVRNVTRAQEIFGTATGYLYPPLEIFTADLSHYDDKNVATQLERAVQGCGAIISVSGALRFSKWTDFLPWRLFRDDDDIAKWADRDHPYFANYKAQALLVDLAQQHGVKRFVRLTGRYLSTSPVSLLFAVVGSRNNQYHYMLEQHLRQSKVPYVILRPGGLATDQRDPSITALQVEDRTILPAPSRVGRADVAELAVLATDSQLLPAHESYELAIRWVGEGIKPKPQGTKEEGCETARECLEKVAVSGPIPLDKAIIPQPTSPLAIGAVVYSLLVLSIQIFVSAIGSIIRLFG